MASIFDVAKYILEEKCKVSTWKLQKLCFYSQAWSLAWTEEPLFPEDFEAWSNGPVCPDLFHECEGLFMCAKNDVQKGDSSNLNVDQKETVNIVLRDYGDMKPYELRELSHKEDPWLIARGTLPEGSNCNNVITKETICAYYRSL